MHIFNESLTPLCDTWYVHDSRLYAISYILLFSDSPFSGHDACMRTETLDISLARVTSFFIIKKWLKSI